MTNKQLTESFSSNQIFAGSWHNQHNSEIVLMIGQNGAVNGSFRLNRNHSHEEVFPLVGYACASAIAFCVNFHAQGSVTSWVGRLVRHQDSVCLETLWHMAVHVNENAQGEMPNSVVSGADLFERGPRTGSMLWQRSLADDED